MKIAVCVMVLAAASACALAQDVSNPVVTSAKEIFQRQSGYMVAAAEQMPADKYGYHPTPDQWTYGKIVSHVIWRTLVCAECFRGRPGQRTDRHGHDSEGSAGAASQAIVRGLPEGTGRAAGLEHRRNDHLFPWNEEAACTCAHRVDG